MTLKLCKGHKLSEGFKGGIQTTEKEKDEEGEKKTERDGAIRAEARKEERPMEKRGEDGRKWTIYRSSLQRQSLWRSVGVSSEPVGCSVCEL
ncbi:hypothetical protein ABG768_024480 [Culter alburnus]|uniref:Uncharacterized protein n=1 Tax=Culter alburnus TaxID=194366 RepID=A0AAW2AMF2_CULAL